MGTLQNIKFTKHTPHLAGWSGMHAQWGVQFDSYALQTPDGVVIVDPIQPPPSVIKQIEQLGEPIAIVLTNANHDRDADWFRKRYAIQIYAHEKAPTDCDAKIDVLIVDNEKLPGQLVAVHLPGAGIGEIALHSKLDGGTLVIGDILLNPAGKGISLLPDDYLEDQKLALKSLTRLHDLKFNNATFAHGAPITGNADEQILSFLKKLKK
jgi:hypothetical protein